MLFLLLAVLPDAGETTIGGTVVALTKTGLTVDYFGRDGRTLRAVLRVTKDTEFKKDGKAVDQTSIRPGTVVRVTVRGRTAVRVKLPDTPPEKESADEEVCVDGDVDKIDLKAKELVVRKLDGKKLTVKLDENPVVRLDREKTTLDAIKRGQTIRVWVYRRSRQASSIGIYEVTERPIGR